MVLKQLWMPIAVAVITSAVTATLMSLSLQQQCQPATRSAAVTIDIGLKRSRAEKYVEVAAGTALYDAVNPWTLQRADDLRPFLAGIDKDMVDRASTVTHAVRVAIVNQTMYIKTRNVPTSWLINQINSSNAVGMPHVALGIFVKVLCNHKVPDMEFAMDVADVERASKKEAPAPLFSWCKTAGQWDILYPYWQHLLWDNLTVSMHVDWDKKIDKAFWRGVTTGAPYAETQWQNLTRVKLVEMCREQPDLCDAQITHYSQLGREARAEMEAKFGNVTQNKTPPQEAGKYKYTIMVDGNSAPSSRMVEALRGNSLLLWQETPWFEPFYRGLRPFIHYVPLSKGLEDLFAKILWARDHPVEVQNIIANAIDYANAFVTAGAAEEHVHQLLLEYGALMRYEVVVTEDYDRVWFEPTVARFYFDIHNLSCPFWENSDHI